MPHARLYCSQPGHRPFEVTLYNRDVRALVKDNEQHREISDVWAEARIAVIEARDAAEARAIALKRYPPERGFVISGVASIGRR
jgi:hypothetical protein